MPHRSVAVQSTAHANPYAERVIGSIRRECLDHLIVLNERHLRRVLSRYVVYYHRARTHLSLSKDAPTFRRVQTSTDGPRIAAFRKSAGYITGTNGARLNLPIASFRSHPFRPDQKLKLEQVHEHWPTAIVTSVSCSRLLLVTEPVRNDSGRLGARKRSQTLAEIFLARDTARSRAAQS